MHFGHCPATSYPRSLEAVISGEDAKMLSSLYFERIRQQHKLKYYGLLHELALMREEDYQGTMSILDRIHRRIQDSFGPHFVIINDFYSLRSASSQMFPDLHMDYDFWNVDSCRGFNLWVLLDFAGGMNKSFDIYDINLNKAMYEKMYGIADRQARQRNSHQRRRDVSGVSGGSNSTRGLPYLPATFFRELRERGGVDGVRGTISNIPLKPGDALIVRQPEVHRTDRQALSPNQWRLALGFKVLHRSPIVQSRTEFGPVSQDLAQIQLRFPGLVPIVQPGLPCESPANMPDPDRRRRKRDLSQRTLHPRPLTVNPTLMSTCSLVPLHIIGPDVFQGARIDAYRKSGDAYMPWHRWLSAYARDRSHLLIPVVICGALLLWAHRDGKRKRAASGL